MPNDGSTADTDLELDLQDANANDGSMDDGERSEDDQSEDEVTENLDLESEKDDKSDEADKAQKREESADNHARSYAAKIISKKATLEDIPANHAYLIPRVKALLGLKDSEKVVKKEEKSSAGKLSVDQQIDLRYFKDKLRAADYDSNQAKTFNEEKNLLLSRGFNLLEAITKAARYAGIDVDAKRADMPKIKTGGSPKLEKTKFTGEEDSTKMSRKQLKAYNEYNQSVGR